MTCLIFGLVAASTQIQPAFDRMGWISFANRCRSARYSGNVSITAFTPSRWASTSCSTISSALPIMCTPPPEDANMSEVKVSKDPLPAVRSLNQLSVATLSFSAIIVAYRRTTSGTYKTMPAVIDIQVNHMSSSPKPCKNRWSRSRSLPLPRISHPSYTPREFLFLKKSRCRCALPN